MKKALKHIQNAIEKRQACQEPCFSDGAIQMPFSLPETKNEFAMDSTTCDTYIR